MKSDNFDLEDRTFRFAKSTTILCKEFRKSFNMQDYIRQLLRSLSSVGANYIEANESLGKKDFLMRIRICIKEAKESAYWIRLILEINQEYKNELLKLYNEAIGLKKIFCTIMLNSK